MFSDLLGQAIGQAHRPVTHRRQSRHSRYQVSGTRSTRCQTSSVFLCTLYAIWGDEVMASYGLDRVLVWEEAYLEIVWDMFFSGKRRGDALTIKLCLLEHWVQSCRVRPPHTETLPRKYRYSVGPGMDSGHDSIPRATLRGMYIYVCVICVIRYQIRPC